MKRPNLFVIGVAKAGTTSMDHYLGEHPDIFMCPKKEPRHFAFEGSVETSIRGPRNKKIHLDAITGRKEYESLFEDAENEAIVGDNSPHYMEKSDLSSKNIFSYAPEAKILAVLRDPVERSYSHYQMNVRSTVEDGAAIFGQSGINEELLIKRLSDSFYVNTGCYHKHLSFFFDRFPAENIKVIFFNDLINETLKSVQSVYEFLGVRSDYDPSVDKKYNTGGLPQSSWIQDLIKKPALLKRLKRKQWSVMRSQRANC